MQSMQSILSMASIEDGQHGRNGRNGLLRRTGIARCRERQSPVQALTLHRTGFFLSGSLYATDLSST